MAFIDWLLGKDQEDRSNGTRNWVGRPAGAVARECPKSRNGYHVMADDHRGGMRCKKCKQPL